MNCKDTQTAIDSASRRNPISQPAAAHVAGCSDCSRYMDQSNALLALLGAQPRVEAPADFDFRLRARIARAESQSSVGPVAVLTNFFGMSFSIKQAAASLAALAVMAAVTTFYFTNGNQPMSNPGSLIAEANKPTPQIPSTALEAKTETSRVSVDVPRPAGIKVAANTYAVNAAKMRPAMVTASYAGELNVARNLASRDESVPVFNRASGKIMKASMQTTSYGVERAFIPAKPQVDAGF